MCGLVGIAGEMFMKDEQVMKSLLIFDYFRGTDSTGFAAFRLNGKDYSLVKMASHPIDLFDSKKFVAALNGNTSQVFLGHNRAATLGKVNGLNAHPFHYGKIIGAHNGTLDKASWKRLEEASGVETDVDSAAIFACIDKIGLKKTIDLMEEGSSAKEGAWALTFIDMEKQTMNFIRNKHRPLWYAWSDDFRRILWASEFPMIDAATALCKSDYDLYENSKEETFFEFAEDTHYEVDLTELRKAGKKAPMKMKVKKMPGRQPPKSSYHENDFTCGYGMGYSFEGHNSGNRKAPWKDDTNSNGNGTGNGSARGQSNSAAEERKEPSNIDLVGSEMYPYGGYLDDTDFRSMSGRGCAWCGSDLVYGDTGVTIIERVDAVLCESCSAPNSDSAIRIFADPVKYDLAISKNWLTARM